MEALVPSRPKTVLKSKKLVVINNHFNIINDATKSVCYQYAIKIEPEIQLDSRELFRDIIEANVEEIRKEVGYFVESGQTLFSFVKIEGEGVFKKHAEYTLILKDTCKRIDMIEAMKNPRLVSELNRVYNVMVKSKFRELGYKEFGMQKKYFNWDKKVVTQSGAFQMYAGYKTSVSFYQGGIPKVLIDYCVKIVRADNLWTEIIRARDKDKISLQ